MKKIECIIMDWAGTAVDFGCFAPLNAFLKVFSEEKGIDITYRQAREPMGLLKIDHIKAILNMPEVKAKFQARYNRDWNMDDVNEMYRSFEKHLFSSLRNFTDPIPGVLDTMKLLREEGIKIGSTTGYTQAMMDVVRPDAAAKGYVVDNLVTPDDVPAGRPAPYMIYKNMPFLQILLNLPFLILGFGMKILFFTQKGMGREYIAGIKNGFQISHRDKKVKFKLKNLEQYIKIQLELWGNLFYRFFA